MQSSCDVLALQAEHGRTQDRMFEALSRREEQQSVKQQDSELAAADMERTQQHIRCSLMVPVLLSGQWSRLSNMQYTAPLVQQGLPLQFA